LCQSYWIVDQGRNNTRITWETWDCKVEVVIYFCTSTPNGKKLHLEIVTWRPNTHSVLHVGLEKQRIIKNTCLRKQVWEKKNRSAFELIVASIYILEGSSMQDTVRKTFMCSYMYNLNVYPEKYVRRPPARMFSIHPWDMLLS
jgi:hypothetical protein